MNFLGAHPAPSQAPPQPALLCSLGTQVHESRSSAHVGSLGREGILIKFLFSFCHYSGIIKSLSQS